jgi:hypothetical protein
LLPVGRDVDRDHRIEHQKDVENPSLDIVTINVEQKHLFENFLPLPGYYPRLSWYSEQQSGSASSVQSFSIIKIGHIRLIQSDPIQHNAMATNPSFRPCMHENKRNEKHDDARHTRMIQDLRRAGLFLLRVITF